MRLESRLLLIGLSTIILVHCAKGASLVDPGPGNGGDGGAPGTSDGAAPPTTMAMGGMGGTAGTGAAGGSTGTGSEPTTTSTGPEPTTTSTGSNTMTSTGSNTMTTTGTGTMTSTVTATSSGTTTSTGTGTTTSTGNTTSSSSSGGGPVDCNPMNPGLVCAASEHCFPTADGNPVCQGPVGLGGTYSGCLDPADCQAALNCIDTGDAFLLPCCLKWCTGSADCPAGSDCVYLADPVYVGNIEYGVCYDGLGGC